MKAKILAVQGRLRYMIDAGNGDAPGATDVPLAYVYDLATDSLSEQPWPVASLAARGYWESPETLPEVTAEDVAERAGAALSRVPSP